MTFNASPATVLAAINARLVGDHKKPVHTSATPTPREHITAVEVEFYSGGREWVSMEDSRVDAYVDSIKEGDYADLSDIDHSAKCWCQK